MPRGLRIALLSLLLLCLPSVGLAQGTKGLQLVLRAESDKAPLGQVICKVYDAEGKMLEYHISSSEGLITLRHSSASYIDFSRLGLEKRRHTIQSSEAKQTIYLREQTKQLREIVVKAEAIRTTGDTISYTADRFIAQQDRYLQDLLAKMPGLQVDPNGMIKYQGEYISRMYIEGKDMLESNYKFASKNLPAEGIASVQVLENHEHIKKLRGKRYNDKAALNIKLKKSYKQRPIGDISLALAGLAPLKGKADAQLAYIGDKLQAMIIPSLNNMGYESDKSNFGSLTLNQMYVYQPAPTPIVEASLRQIPELELRRYLDNHSASTLGNALTKLGEHSDLKLNLWAMGDKRHQHYDQTYTLGGAKPSSWARASEQTLREQEYAGKFVYELNAPKTYLINTSRLEYRRQRAEAMIHTNHWQDKQESDGESYTFNNLLSTHLNIGRRTLSLSSFAQYSKLPEYISGEHSDGSVQHFAHHYQQRLFTLNHYAELGWQWSQHSLSLGLSQTYQAQRFTIDNRQSHSSLFSLGLQPRYSLSYKGAQIAIELSPQLYLSEPRGSAAESETKLLALNPSLSWRQQMGDKWQLKLNGSISHSLDNQAYRGLGIYRTSYWSYTQPLDGSYKQSNKNLGLQLSYKDTYRALFGHLSARYSIAERAYIYHSDYYPSHQIRTALIRPNERRILSLAGGLDKAWVDKRTSLKYLTNYQRSSYDLGQDRQLTQHRSELLVQTLSLQTQPLAILRIKAELSHQLQWSHNESYGHQPLLSQWTGQIGLQLSPHKSYGFKLETSAFKPNKPSEVPATIFADLSAYWHIGKRLELSLLCSNLGNMRHYRITYLQDVNTDSYSMPLRGRELSLGLKYKL